MAETVRSRLVAAMSTFSVDAHDSSSVSTISP